MKLIKIMMTTLAVLVMSMTAHAKDLDGEYAVFGIGSNSCASFQTVKRTGQGMTEYVVWTEAYLSAFNLIVPSTYNIAGESNFTQMMNWLGDYCRDNPNELYVNAVAALTVALYPSRLNLAPGKDNSKKWTEPLR